MMAFSPQTQLRQLRQLPPASQLLLFPIQIALFLTQISSAPGEDEDKQEKQEEEEREEGAEGVVQHTAKREAAA